MSLEALPDPVPAPGTALVAVEAAGVNFIDVYHRSGAYPGTLPLALGLEGAGTVAAVGAGVTDVRPGDRVAWSGVPGSYATRLLAPAERLVLLPPGISTQLAAAVMLQGLTAHMLSHSVFPLASGATALVHAAAGGVGLLLCQMARMRGAEVIGTVSTPEKARLAGDAGASETILYTETDFEAEVRRITFGRGVQVVYDSVGKDTFDKSLGCLAPRGTMVLFGQSSGRVPPLDPQVLSLKGSLFLTRPTVAHYTQARDEYLRRANEVFGWIQSGRLTVRVAHTYPLAEAARAHRDLEARTTSGKVLLLVTADASGS